MNDLENGLEIMNKVQLIAVSRQEFGWSRGVLAAFGNGKIAETSVWSAELPMLVRG